MNPKDLEGRSVIYQKDAYESALVAEFEITYGFEGNWSLKTVKEFERRWEEIQEKFKEVK